MATNPSQISEDLTNPSPYMPTSAEVEHRLTQLQNSPPKPKKTRHPPPSSQSLRPQPHRNHPPIKNSKKPPSTALLDASSIASRPHRSPSRCTPPPIPHGVRKSHRPRPPLHGRIHPPRPQPLRHPRRRFQQSPQRHQLEPHRQPVRRRRPGLALHARQRRAPHRQRPPTGPPRSAAAHRPPPPRPLRRVRHRRPLPQAWQRSPFASAPLRLG